MTAPIPPAVLEFARSRAEAVERSARSRFGPGNGTDLATLARELEDHIQEVLTFPAMLRRDWESVYFHASRGPVQHLEFLGEYVRDIWTLCAGTIRGVLNLCDALRNQATLAVAGRDALEAAAAEVERMRDDLLRDWPWPPTAEEAAEARAAIGRSEYVDAEAAFAEMEGVSVEELQRRIEEHRRKHYPNGIV